ncbi:par-3 family cell polarity regulator beta a isoform X3 [Takifugu flavidus]|uniref:par-3 family cell polarity regulator beta a isoform X3 n=1 Tax=Takifugu flavidus TaxID=433684 RepID=UPI0025445519|nr:par-3 family cell polarity regulator beta a isoform X3 [Takifugu flavidus]
MKVTVTFGDTSVVVPCKSGWTVRDLIDQATRRYRRILEQHGESAVKTHHLEYAEGGILDMDDMLSDLVEDRDKLVAIFDEVHAVPTASPSESMFNGDSSSTSPEPFYYFPHLDNKESIKGEIEVNEAILKANTPLLVRSSSDSALVPPLQTAATPTPEENGSASLEPEPTNGRRGDLNPLHTDGPRAKMNQVDFRTLTRTVKFPGEWGPLGIHVVPYCSSLSGRTLGLHIKGIEEDSLAKKQKLFQEDECIVQINDIPLQDKTFAQSQDVFRQAMATPSVHLEVLSVPNKTPYEKSLIGQLFTGDGRDLSAKTKSPMSLRVKANLQPEPKGDKLHTKLEVRQPDMRSKTPEPESTSLPPALQSGQDSQERVSQTAPESTTRASPTPKARSQSPLATRSPITPGLPNLTTKRGGKRIKIDLKKGAEGLGFTVVTRDSSVHGPGPILVKNILQRGAAVKDGRLQPGDRILEVNGVDMTGRSQEELVAMLRSTKQGECVYMVVARQEDLFLPRELKGEEARSLVLEDGREQLMYEIPLNETGSAGLGVSLKGNKSRETGEDLGIFIKSIIHGGAAYKDGRLSVNDQLLAINGESLLGRSNHAAMETLRHSMSSEGNSRGTIQLVVLRAPRQLASTNPRPSTTVSGSTANQPSTTMSLNQEAWDDIAYQGPSGAPNSESILGSGSRAPQIMSKSIDSGSAANGSYGHYGNSDEEWDDGFPPPPSPRSVEEMGRDFPLTPSQPSEFQKQQHLATDDQLTKDNKPRNRTSKSMDLVADESNMDSLVRRKNEPSADGVLGPTLGLWKSSSLESLQTAVSEAKQSHIQAQVPFHRPRPHVVRGRGCNQSFRIAIDKSYDGPSEDDDDFSEHSSGHETPVSSSSRQDLDAEEGKKKKTKGKKKEKKSKGKKKTDEAVEDTEKKTKKKGFTLLRFGKKKEDKSKASKNKLEALSEEELEKIPNTSDRYQNYGARYTEVRSGHLTPDPASLPDFEDDDSDPNYARINTFRQPPPPQTFVIRTPSPGGPAAGSIPPQASLEELDGLYAKVNKPRPPPAHQIQPQTQTDSDQRLPGSRREYQQARAAPGYEELDAARRRVLEHDPQRLAPRESRPGYPSEDRDREYPTHPRRDPYDYPTHSRPVPRELGPFPGQYSDPPASSRMPIPQSAGQPNNQRYRPSSPSVGRQRPPLRQDVPPTSTVGYRGRQYYEPAGRQLEEYGEASPGRYASPDRYAYSDDNQPDSRRKNPMIGAV